MPSSTDAIQKVAYRAGDYIFLEGDQERHFYIVEKGEVQIFTKKASGEHVEIFSVTQGEAFGEFALLDGAPRSASAKALTDVVLVKVSEEGYQQLLSELPIWASSMMKSFIARLKNMNQKIK
ncbi:MAG: Crp/Fnr family transcriptional regulator [Bdellovibrionales bacterium]